MSYKLEKFYDGFCIPLKFDDPIYNHLKTYLMNFFNLKGNVMKFPGALPVTLTRKNLHLLVDSKVDSESDSDSNSDDEHSECSKGAEKKNYTMEHSEVFDLPNGKKSRRRRLIMNNYFVKRKSNGQRHFLMFSPNENNDPNDPFQSVWDRRLNCKLVKFAAPLGMHQGTLVDGEVIKEADGSHTFYPIDVIGKEGIHLRSDAFGQRQRLLEEFIRDIQTCEHTQESPFRIKLKNVGTLKHLKSFLESENLQHLSDENADYSLHTTHPCDGLIFDLASDKVIVGTNNNSLKWKPPKFSTIDFEIRICEDPHFLHLCIETKGGVQMLYEQKTSETIRFPYTLPYPYDDLNEISSSNSSNQGKKINVEFFDHKIVEMERCKKTRKWFFLTQEKVRTDKTKPNYVTVAMDVIASLDDDITIEDLIALSRKL